MNNFNIALRAKATGKFKGYFNPKLFETEGVTSEQLHDLGFYFWKENHVLIPLWAVKHISPALQVISISKRITILYKADLYTRYGCIAYGFLSNKFLAKRK